MNEKGFILKNPPLPGPTPLLARTEVFFFCSKTPQNGLPAAAALMERGKPGGVKPGSFGLKGLEDEGSPGRG